MPKVSRFAFAPLALILSTLAFAQNGSIEGRVTNEAGQPLKNAQVELRQERSRSPGGIYAETDAAGNFVFLDVEPGRYNFWADRAGYLTNGGVVPLTVAPGQHVTGISIKMTQAALIAGRVVDEYGDPMSNAHVQLLREGMESGPSSTSRADGSFVIGKVAAGRYHLYAEAAAENFGSNIHAVSGPQFAYVLTYFPSVANPSKATVLTLKAGQEVRNLEIRMAKARLFRVAGKVIDKSTGAAVPNASLYLRSAEPPNSYLNALSARDGTFEFPRVAPAEYVLFELRRSDPNITSQFGQLKVTVANANLEDLTLSGSPGLEISGAIRLEGGGSISNVRVDLNPNIPGISTTRPSFQRKDDGSFIISEIEPKAYRVQVVDLPAGAYVKSLRFGGQDVTNADLDLTQDTSGKTFDILLAPHAAEITGVAREADGKALTGVNVTLRSPGGAFGARTDQNGAFEFQNLRPGEYRIGVWNDDADRSDYDRQAATLTLKEDDRVTAAPPLIVHKPLN